MDRPATPRRVSVGHHASYLLRDRDRIFDDEFTKQIKNMGIKEVLSAPRSPWQRAYIERLIGPLRREMSGSRDRL
jgi:hypothetical protein